MQTIKKLWTKPVLVVIGRGTPEERVLTTCKLNSGGPALGSVKCAGSIICQSAHAS